MTMAELYTAPKPLIIPVTEVPQPVDEIFHHGTGFYRLETSLSGKGIDWYWFETREQAQSLPIWQRKALADIRERI